VTLTIDGRPVTVPEGATVLDAARLAGIDIPTLCHLPGKPAQTSCLVCVVRIDGGARLRPACATRVAEGMRVESNAAEVRAARRTALELLLGHHLGDCLAPCEIICPVRYDVPLMLRQVQAGRLDLAIATIKEGSALPATFGRICPHFCERGCRRANADGAVSIQAVERAVADADLASATPYLPPCRPATDKRVTVVGAGPAGLSAAYHLSRFGHACTLIDENDRAGGQLRRAVAEGLLPVEVLDAEISSIMRLGLTFRPGTRLGCDVTLEQLRSESDAVLIAVGVIDADRARDLGLEFAEHGLAVTAGTFRTAIPGVFAAGNAVSPVQQAVRAAGAGGEAVSAIDAALTGATAAGHHHVWSIHAGKLPPDQLAPWLAGASPDARREAGPAGLDQDAARAEAARCLRCACASRDACQLRRYAADYGAGPHRFRGELPPLAIDQSNPLVDFEPGKCILCGLCVLVAAEHGERLGLGFIGRGFRVQVAAPFHADLRAGLALAARACAEVCPTGAIVLKEPHP
jgi:NADPH-dependent glutamate synthase beta subunit-like oxidoreductase/ferredoxin/NAD-dependent dihydropyrimidine dehydrogenase PreA subunit